MELARNGAGKKDDRMQKVTLADQITIPEEFSETDSDYSEDSLVEKSAILEFEKLGYPHQNCFHEKFWLDGKGTLGRKTKSEVLLVRKLSEAIKKLNPDICGEAEERAIEELAKDRSRLSPVKANQEVYSLIKNGVKVKVRNEKGEIEDQTVKIIDFDSPKNNEFFLASQFWITGEMHTRRTDLLGFVNGIPLIFIEVKATGRRVKEAYDDNLTDYKDTIPQLFWYNAFIILSNGRESKIGTITSGFEHFGEWKRVRDEKEPGDSLLDTMITGSCEKSRFLDILENFTLFSSSEGHPVKIISKNHQYLGVNNAIESFKKRKENEGKIGVFWHTQGSGKSYSMIFFAQKILRKFPGNYTFVVVTDREELDEQIYRNFQNAGVISEVGVQARSGGHLKQLLTEDHRLVFTLIHKFGTKKGVKHPLLSDRDDIIIIADEAHRIQYDTLAQNMKDALPNAGFIGFTGTPLIVGEEKTRDTFGDYVSIYNFKHSIADGATVPLYYENRVPEVQLKNENLNDDIYGEIEKAGLDDEEESKLATEFANEYNVIVREDRLETIAKDIVEHYVTRGYAGKALVISIDKLTTVKMYDKVQKYWNMYINELKEQRKAITEGEEAKVLEKLISEFEGVDMAVVVSQGQNEVKKFEENKLDIRPHRKRMIEEDLEEIFKDSKSSLKIVFVCSKWREGFDVPSLSTIYLDRPMKGHSLMQTIARANRVFGEKTGGFIVDYVGIFENLEQALKIYASPKSGGREAPIKSKEKLLKTLKKKIKEINKFLSGLSVDSKKILKTKTGFEKIRLLKDATDAILKNESTKKKFLTEAGAALKIYKSILPHKRASEFLSQITLYEELVKEIRSLDPEVDISKIRDSIQRVLDKSIESKKYIIEESKKGRIFGLKDIDFDALADRFDEQHKNTEFEWLKNLISYKLREMVRLNSSRLDYQKKFETLIEAYNSGSANVDYHYKELIKFAKELKQEDERAIIESLSEEELSLFDKLKKPDLKEKEKSQVRKVAKELLATLKAEKLVLDWRKKQQAIAAVKKEIEDELDRGLPDSYGVIAYEEKCNTVFQHIYDSYAGDNHSVYEAAA
ncbi:Type I restriction-modification system, restriction subunit R [Methanosarcina lacustris Z-7289]|uniref:type I site-specific deoxyribonuclease n=1 Tax=Methanosarcina lacustris Z-7289 TaxID=1434111 RepID=A0A0E3S4B1_9EURY|nr:type I restriction endonuclease subunit R [Methanosarcina lacustris]AKB75076.1 Type I restriction-modification system, restriction subunit R [Methanosarcina lacustris Z-7289]